MMKKLLLLSVPVFLAAALHAQSNVGIGTNDPKSKLDIEGGLSLREGSALVLANGNNDNIVLTGNYSFYRITGPTSTFSILGIIPNSGADGQVLTLVNTTAQSMTIKNNSSVTPAYSITTLTGGDFESVSGNSSITLQYNKTAQRWYVTANQNYKVSAANLSTKDIVPGTGSAVTVVNGANQVIGGGNVVLDVTTNGLNQKGIVPGPTGLNASQAWVTDPSGNPAWAKVPNANLQNSSVTVNTGTGLSGGGNVALGGTLNIVNTAPDQTVTLTGGGINTVSGTYPNFTVTGTEADGSVTNEGSLTVGAGTVSTSVINSNTSGSTAVTLQAGSNVTLTETGNTITIASSNSGGTVTNVATGSGLTGGPITTTGTISVATSGITSTHIADGTVSSTDIADGTVTSTDITDGTITSADISNGTLVAADLANTGVTAGSYNNVTVNAQGQVTAGSNAAYLTGNQTITLSGDVSGSGTTAITTTIANNAVNNAKLNDMAVNTIKGRITAGTGDPEDLTAAQVKTILGLTNGVTGTGTTNYVPKWTGANTLSGTSLIFDNGTAVGIGTANPAQGKLWVEGGDIWVLGNNTKLAFTTDGSTDNTPNASIIAAQNGISGASADLMFNTWNGSANVEIMRVRSNGNVGIGTNAPVDRLDVRDAMSVNEIKFRNVGGGDDSDPYRLRKVMGSSNTNWLELQLNDDPNEEFRIYGYSCSGYGCGEYSGNLYHSFRADGTTYHAGSVGIGTTGPTATLDVNGSARIRGLGAGFVKSDASGNLSVAGISTGDLPSHTHTWGQVTSKPASWLDGSNLIADNGNFNNSVPSGFYQSSGAANAPGGGWYNMINVRHSNTGNDHGFQIAASYYDENIWTRTYQGGTGANNGSFTPWRKTIHTGNVASEVAAAGFIPNNGSGDWQIASNSNATSYSQATLELRETNFAGGGQQPPRLGFHWGGVVASQISVENSGRIAIRDNPGTGYENFVARTITATGGGSFSGTVYNRDWGTNSGTTAARIMGNADNANAGGIAVSDDGGFYEYNNGWVTYEGTTGLQIRSGATGSGANLAEFYMLTNGGSYNDKKVTTSQNNWGYLGYSGQAWYWMYANNKSSIKPNSLKNADATAAIVTDNIRNYCTESVKYTIEDWGVAKMINGVAEVTFDEYTRIWLSPFVNPVVTITPMGNCNGVYIEEITPSGFKIRELNGGTSNAKFSWRLAGIRAGDEVVCSVVDDALEAKQSELKNLRTLNPEKIENRNSLIQYITAMYQEAKKRNFTTALEQLDLTAEGKMLAARLGISFSE